MVDGQWFCGSHGGDDASLPIDREYLTATDRDAIEKAAGAVHEHGAEKLRRATGQYEVVAIADLQGVLCKARIDKWIAKPATIVDVKKVGAPKRPGEASIAERFQWKIADYSYGMQAGMYCDMMVALGQPGSRWFWIVVEDGEPYSVGIYQASADCLNAGRNQYRVYLDRMKSCEASGVWPGLTRDIEIIDGPRKWLKENGQE
jgi:hypothetical protein